MIILITGASHTGKTLLAQKLLEKYNYPPIVREIIKTVIENRQNLIIEGCYIPFDWKKDFTDEYRKDIRGYCLAMSENYIRMHFDDIKQFANVIENRLDDEDCTLDNVLKDNARTLSLAKENDLDYILIDGEYEIDMALF